MAAAVVAGLGDPTGSVYIIHGLPSDGGEPSRVPSRGSQAQLGCSLVGVLMNHELDGDVCAYSTEDG